MASASASYCPHFLLDNVVSGNSQRNLLEMSQNASTTSMYEEVGSMSTRISVNLFDHFSTLPDPRVDRTKRHLL